MAFVAWEAFVSLLRSAWSRRSVQSPRPIIDHALRKKTHDGKNRTPHNMFHTRRIKKPNPSHRDEQFHALENSVNKLPGR
jgi:hypothetical protein